MNREDALAQHNRWIGRAEFRSNQVEINLTNAKTAEAFAALWNVQQSTGCDVVGSSVTINTSIHSVIGDRFERAAEWFYHAAQCAMEIVEGALP